MEYITVISQISKCISI